MSFYKKVVVNLWARACGLMQRFKQILEDVFEILASWKITLVKQVNNTGRYTNPEARTVFQLLESSTMRSEPIGFWPDGKLKKILNPAYAKPSSGILIILIGGSVF